MPPPNTPENIEEVLAATTAIENAARSSNSDLNLFRQLPIITPSPARMSLEHSSSRSARAPNKSVDLQALNYVDPVDDNLLCPICTSPLVEPVTTPCDHTFCRACLKRSCEESSICPVDRETISFSRCPSTSRLIKNQLDSLRVECPNSVRGCNDIMKREVVVSHVEHRCQFALLSCREADCTKKTLRKDIEKPCQHEENVCEHCGTKIEMASMQKHLEEDCASNITACGGCGEQISFKKLKAHLQECPEADTACQYAQYGCTHVTKKNLVSEHHESCVYKILSFLGQQVIRQSEQIQTLEAQEKLKSDKIANLERVVRSISRAAARDLSDAFRSNVAAGAGVANVPDMSPDGAIFSAYHSLERQLEELSKTVTDLETRQTVMVLNQVMPIKDQITEIRSTLGMLKMHVAWLMTCRREELERSRIASRSAAAAAAAGSAAARSGGGGSTSAGRGRLNSDSEGEVHLGAPPRRQSDGSDLPRL